jgi:hypothetical protein
MTLSRSQLSTDVQYVVHYGVRKCPLVMSSRGSLNGIVKNRTNFPRHNRPATVYSFPLVKD